MWADMTAIQSRQRQGQNWLHLLTMQVAPSFKSTLHKGTALFQCFKATARPKQSSTYMFCISLRTLLTIICQVGGICACSPTAVCQQQHLLPSNTWEALPTACVAATPLPCSAGKETVLARTGYDCTALGLHLPTSARACRAFAAHAMNTSMVQLWGANFTIS